MNIDYPEVTNIVVAKTCGCMKGKRKVAYQFLEEYHGLRMDKKDMLAAQLDAREKLLHYAKDPIDREAITKEIEELRLALDLMQ